MKTTNQKKVIAVVMAGIFFVANLPFKVLAEEPGRSDQEMLLYHRDGTNAPSISIEQADEMPQAKAKPSEGRMPTATEFLIDNPLSSADEKPETEEGKSGLSKNLAKIQGGSFDWTSKSSDRDKGPLSKPDEKPQSSIAVVGSIKVQGNEPWESAITPDGSEVYVANRLSNTVDVIDTATQTVKQTIKVGNGPEAMALSKDGSTLYVGQQGGNISVISVRSKAVVDSFRVGGPVRDLALSPDGSQLYVPMEYAGLKSINLRTRQVTALATLGLPEHVVFSPDGTKAYVNTQGGSRPGAPGHDPIAVYEVATGKLIGSITHLPDGTRMRNVGSSMAISPDGSQLWVNGSDACRYSSASSTVCPSTTSVIINVIRTSDKAVIKTLFGNFWHISFSPDGSKAFVGSIEGLRVYDTKTLELVQTLNIPAAGRIVFSSDASRAYAVLPGKNEVAVLQMPSKKEQKPMTRLELYIERLKDQIKAAKAEALSALARQRSYQQRLVSQIEQTRLEAESALARLTAHVANLEASLAQFAVEFQNAIARQESHRDGLLAKIDQTRLEEQSAVARQESYLASLKIQLEQLNAPYVGRMPLTAEQIAQREVQKENLVRLIESTTLTINQMHAAYQARILGLEADLATANDTIRQMHASYQIRTAQLEAQLTQARLNIGITQKKYEARIAQLQEELKQARIRTKAMRQAYKARIAGLRTQLKLAKEDLRNQRHPQVRQSVIGKRR